MDSRSRRGSPTLVLLGAAGYEALAAAGVIDPGNEPGEEPFGEAVVSAAAALGFLIAFAAVPVAASRNLVRRAIPWITLPLAAGAYMVARFYAYDPYYAPTLRRASDGGVVSPWWVLVLGATTVLTAIVARLSSRLGAGVTIVIAGLCGLTSFVERLGH
jgi:hypothetical protein